MLKQLKGKDIKPLKEVLWLKNGRRCPLLNKEIPLEKMALDHIHGLVSLPASEQRGTIRNAIEFRANALEGKITNNWKRYFGADESKHPISLPDYLRNLANYLEAGAYSDNGVFFIHPTEKQKELIVSKRNYNKLKKLYVSFPCSKAKFPDYPKSKKLTKKLKLLFEDYRVPPYN